MNFIFAAIASFFASFIVVPIFLKVLHAMGFYTIIEERVCMVYMLFGKVVGTIDEPGLHFLWLELGPKALLVPWIGARHKVDLRLDHPLAERLTKDVQIRIPKQDRGRDP